MSIIKITIVDLSSAIVMDFIGQINSKMCRDFAGLSLEARATIKASKENLFNANMLLVSELERDMQWQKIYV
jgi:hypothetical protein